MLRAAREACAAGARVWWVGLPAQRASVYRRATLDPLDGGGPDGGGLAGRAGPEQAPALLGLEFLTLQQVYYRLLARARELHPLVIGSGRLVMVGEALAEIGGQVPAPGEARLFAQAIAEAKRFAVSPDGLRAEAERREDPERMRLAEVFAAYERLKAAADEGWDYDDFRAAALELVERRPDACEAGVVIVDGFRELGPLELRVFRALAAAAQVHVTLPRVPEGFDLPAGAEVAPVMPGAPATRLERYRAPNPVAEARWVLRSLKRDLAEGGLDPLSLALIAPPERIAALEALADEYGVPLVDETPQALADTPAGRLLVELLELPDYPTPSGVLAVPELAPLADAALDAGVAGGEAMAALARSLGLETAWRAWLATLEVDDAPLAWARRLLGEVLPGLLGSGGARHGSGATRGGGPAAGGNHRAGAGTGGSAAAGRAGVGPSDGAGASTDGAPAGGAPEPSALPGLPPRFHDMALRAAQEASRLATGPGFRAWWAALLRQGRLARDGRGGVALVTATLASGRRFDRAYVLGANEGVYGAGEREDYFVPEEDRQDAALSLARLGLPRRFQGRDPEVLAELLARAGSLVVSFPEADQGGPMLPEPALVGETPGALPDVRAGSALELPGGARFRAEDGAVDLGAASVAALERYAECGFRYWAERRLRRGPEAGARPWWAELRAALRASPELSEARVEQLAAAYPEASGWLREHAGTLRSFTYGVRLPAAGGSAPFALVDAAVRDGGHATLVRFCAPGQVQGEAEAEAYVKDRWTELWAAGHLLERYRGRVARVDVTVWPILGAPIPVFPRGIRHRWRQIESRERRAEEAYARFARGEAEPRPGYRCTACPVFDVCREGRL